MRVGAGCQTSVLAGGRLDWAETKGQLGGGVAEGGRELGAARGRFAGEAHSGGAAP